MGWWLQHTVNVLSATCRWIFSYYDHHLTISVSMKSSLTFTVLCVSCCCCSVAQSCLIVGDPMDCSTPGYPVLQYLPEFLKIMSIESMMPFNHLILCHSLFLLPSVFFNIEVLSNESVLLIRWPKYWSFCFSISSSNEYSGLISFRMD